MAIIKRSHPKKENVNLGKEKESVKQDQRVSVKVAGDGWWIFEIIKTENDWAENKIDIIKTKTKVTKALVSSTNSVVLIKIF